MSAGVDLNRVIERVETLTGYPVTIDEDVHISTLATVRIAGPSQPFTHIRFNPKSRTFREYVICFQCGFALRQLALPEHDRFAIAATFRGKKELDRSLKEHLQANRGGRISKDVRDKIAAQMLNGIILQLRSMPIGLRIDDWLFNEYPGLRDQQRESAIQQLEDNGDIVKSCGWGNFLGGLLFDSVGELNSCDDVG